MRVATDAGDGFVKTLGNRGGPHLLAAELVATQLAQWLGLPTFDFAVVEVTELDEIRFVRGGMAQPGPAFITRYQSGMVWDGAAEALQSLINPEDIGKLVLFDTWTRNCDRHPPDLTQRKVNRNNVFLSNEGMPDGQFELVAMDHTHCFNCGRDLNAQLAHIDLVKDDRLFGLFPEFKPFIRPHWQLLLEAITKLKTLDGKWVEGLAGAIPAEWQMDAAGRAALAMQVCNRASYMCESFIPLLEEQLK